MSRADFAQELNWHIEEPKASMFIWTKIPQQFSHLSSFDFCKKILLETGVAMSPGSSFGDNGEGFVRFSMIRNENEIDETILRLRKIFSFKF